MHQKTVTLVRIWQGLESTVKISVKPAEGGQPIFH